MDKKYTDQRQVSLIFTAGQKYAWVGLGPISTLEEKTDKEQTFPPYTRGNHQHLNPVLQVAWEHYQNNELFKTFNFKVDLIF